MEIYFYEDIHPKGLTNQILFLIDYLICLYNNVKSKGNDKVIVILHYFFDDFENHSLLTPISNVINLENLSKKYFPQFIFLDLNALPQDMQIEWVSGDLISKIHLKDFFFFVKVMEPTKYVSSPLLVKDTSVCIVRIKCPSKNIDHCEMKYENGMLTIDRVQYYSVGLDIFYDTSLQSIFKDIQFLNSTVDSFHDELCKYDTRHVIHLRLEEDSINAWWSSSNAFDSKDHYIDNIITRYLQKMEELLIPDERSLCILLSSPSSHNQKISDWLEKRAYHTFQRPYDLSRGREYNAIQDLSLATQFGNGVFIGHSRSTFSKWIQYRMNAISFHLI